MSGAKHIRMNRRLFLCAFSVVALTVVFLPIAARDGEVPAVADAGMLCVVIDAGHGGGDPGKVGKISHEDDINLAVAKKLQAKLQLRGVRVIMTRSDEEGLKPPDAAKWIKKVDMQMRRDIIDSSNADLMISIHQNSHSNSANRGAQVFYNGLFEENMEFAQIVQRNVAAVAPVPNRRVCVDEREFMMLRGNSMPSCLIECGFMSNKSEELILNDDAYQDAIAQAIYESMLEYFGIEP